MDEMVEEALAAPVVAETDKLAAIVASPSESVIPGIVETITAPQLESGLTESISGSNLLAQDNSSKRNGNKRLAARKSNDFDDNNNKRPKGGDDKRNVTRNNQINNPIIIPSVALSSRDKAAQIVVSKDQMTCYGEGGYRMIRGTHGVHSGAYFWEAGKGTCTPPGVWNLIAQKLVEEKHDLLERLYVFSTLNDALFDTAIVVWYNKYKYNYWRPNMAFKNWEPLLKTPPFPEYGSGHSSFSGAGSEILTSFFGEHSFSLTMKNMTRVYNNFYDAAYEAGRSRIYGGIHFEFSNIPSINMGMSIAREVLRELKKN